MQSSCMHFRCITCLFAPCLEVAQDSARHKEDFSNHTVTGVSESFVFPNSNELVSSSLNGEVLMDALDLQGDVQVNHDMQVSSEVECSVETPQ